MNSLRKREKILLCILVAVVFFYIYYTFFLNTMIKLIETSKISVEKHKVEVQRVRNAKTTIAKQREEIESLQDELVQKMKIIPQMERNPEIAYNLKKLGDNNGVLIDSLGIGEPSELNKAPAAAQTNQGEENNKNEQEEKQAQSNKVFLVPVTISAKGGYIPVMNFILSIEGDDRISKIHNLGLNSNSQSGELNVSINLEYYYTDRVNDDALEYDFNEDKYGKGNLFN